MSRWEWKHALIAVITLSVVGVVATYGVSSLLARHAAGAIREAQLDVFVRAIESGAGAFAHVHSAQVSQEQLDSLIDKTPDARAMLISVRLLANFPGETDSRVYAQWSRAADQTSQIFHERRLIPLASEQSLATWQVELVEDRQYLPPALATLTKWNGALIAAIFGVLAAVSAFFLVPFMSGLRIAEGAVEQLDENLKFEHVERIRFGPLYRLAQMASAAATLEKQAALGRQAEQVAHDLGSPLAALDVVFRMGNPKDELQQLGTSAIQRIQDIVRDLNPKTREKSPREIFDLSAVVQNIVSEKRLAEPQLQWTLDCQNEVTLPGTGSDIARSVSNLIQNAVEASGREGRIALTLKKNLERVALEIVDSGRGMTEVQLKRIGQRGVSFGKEQHATSGSGLGVFQAKQTVEAAGGTIQYDSTPGIGTRVFIQFPIG